jgi:serine/threonine-protein kinase
MREGHLLNDRYEIKRMIGGGGMANVYLAWDTILDREVAVKVLRTEYANEKEFIARFDREAQAASSLTHPNIVSIYDVGEEDHLLYMVMEYVDGMTLKEYIQNYHPIPVTEAIDIMKQISSAIALAHDHNIVHRDIKPQNILIDKNRNVKVTDFGIAMALSSTALTQTNSILGSVHYLSPEQARGGLATKKSDIYSIGIVLFELLTGRIPFSGQSPVAIALKHLQSDTPSVRQVNPEVPQSVENIVLKATAKDPFHRYDNVYEIETALESALDPNKMNESPYETPEEEGEETKAIPIITDDHYKNSSQEDTLVHSANEKTQNYPPGNQEGETNDKKPPKKKKKLRWTLLIILFILLAAGTAALFLIPGLLLPKEINMPDVVEMEYAEAVEVLENHDLVVVREDVFSDEVEEGYVTDTDPSPGRMVQEESEVTLFVSMGKERVSFDNYVGEDFSQVERLLEDEGYEVISYEKYSDEPQGDIITQIQPEPETEVVPSETRVIFEISIGPELVELNNLRGMTEEEAKSYLEEQNLSINVIEEHSENVPEGEVIRQSPESGAELNEGSTVDVYLSAGPEEQTPISHSVSYTVPYTAEEDEEDDEEDKEEQVVRIYIDDADNDLSEVYLEESITEETEFTFTLTIMPDSEAEYMIMRDEDEIRNETISYEESGE